MNAQLMTFITTWLFDKCDAIISGYSSMRSLISLKARVQIWIYRVCRRILAMSFFCDWYHSIDGCDVIKCYHRSQISQIADCGYRRSHIVNIADRSFAWSQIADHNIARFSLCCFVLLVWHCDMRRRISAVGVSLGSPFSSALNARNAMGSRVTPF